MTDGKRVLGLIFYFIYELQGEVSGEDLSCWEARPQTYLVPTQTGLCRLVHSSRGAQ